MFDVLSWKSSKLQETGESPIKRKKKISDGCEDANGDGSGDIINELVG